MRPGRLDRLLYVGPPDLQAREEIFKIRTRTMSVGPGFDASVIARMVSCRDMTIVDYESPIMKLTPDT